MERVDKVRKDKKLGVCFEASNNLKKYVFGDTIEELIDGLGLLNDGRFINEFLWKFPDLTKEQLERLDILMARTTNAEEIVEYAIKRGDKLSNREEIEKRLVEFQDIFKICKYAKKGKVNNIEAFVELFCEKKVSPDIIWWIAKTNGANLHKLKKLMFERSEYISELIEFCSYCQKKSSDIITLEDLEKVEQIVVDSNCAIYLRLCAEELEGVNIEKLQKMVEESKDPDEILSFARKVKGADIDSLRKAIRKTKNAYYIGIFEREFGGISTIDKIKNFFK